MTSFRIPLIIALASAAVAFWAVSVRAALPPQYDRWNEFAAIVGVSAIPQKLGLVDRIERAGDLTYRVYGGKCVLTVMLIRRAAADAKGQALIGPSVVSIRDVGEPRC
jgi:hypothetical protein